MQTLADLHCIVTADNGTESYIFTPAKAEVLPALSSPGGCLCSQVHGPEALKVIRRQKAERQRLQDFRNSVERRLRLRRLVRDETLQDAQFISCCKRMLFNSDSLSQIMEGLSFRISHTNQVAPEGTHIDIAWDFEV